MTLRELFRARPRTPAHQRDHVRAVVFAGTVVGILLVVVAAIVAVARLLARYGSA